MNIRTNILVVLFCAVSQLAMAQGVFTKPKPQSPAKKPVAAQQESPKSADVTTVNIADSVRNAGEDNLNKLDEKGNRNGTWWITEPAARGEEGYTTFGPYDHGQKTGKWCKVNEHGELISIENYAFDVLNGEAKYYDRGRVTAIGNYRGLNPTHEFDTIAIVDPATGAETLKAIATEKGYVRHGLWRYYDMNNGALLREEEYQLDELIYRKDIVTPKLDSAGLAKQDEKIKASQAKPYVAPVKKKQVSYIDIK